MNWSQAFARQAASDLAAHQTLLNDRSLPSCHSLHYLQMACEKLCKAAVIKAGTDPLAVQRSHAYISKRLPMIVQIAMGQKSRSNWIVRATARLARKIELLNPAVQDGGRSPQNCEYPWAAPSGQIIAPADHKFEFNELFEPAGVTLLKIMRQVSAKLQE